MVSGFSLFGRGGELEAQDVISRLSGMALADGAPVLGERRMAGSVALPSHAGAVEPPGGEVGGRDQPIERSAVAPQHVRLRIGVELCEQAPLVDRCVRPVGLLAG